MYAIHFHIFMYFACSTSKCIKIIVLRCCRSAGDSLTPAAGSGGADGEIVGGPRTPQQIAAQRRLQQTQAQVDEVVDIMKTNVEKVLERDQKLSELDDRAGKLIKADSKVIITIKSYYSRAI